VKQLAAEAEERPRKRRSSDVWAALNAEVQYLDDTTAAMAAPVGAQMPAQPRRSGDDIPVDTENPLGTVDLNIDLSSMPDARKFYSKLDDHLELVRRVKSSGAKADEENRMLSSRLQELARENHSKSMEIAQLVGQVRSLEEKLVEKPKDEVLAAMEERLKEEGKKKKELELELESFLDERRSCRLETARVSRAEDKAANFEAKLSQSETEKELLRKQLLYAQSDLNKGEDVSATLAAPSSEADKENCTQQ
jgi:hypothetical protein